VNGNILPKSMAFLEELEYISGLLSILWPHFKFWKKNQNYVDFYKKINTLIISKTLLLFDPKKQKEQYFKTHSIIEKSMNEVDLRDSKIGDKENPIISLSPQKRSKEFVEDKYNLYRNSSFNNNNFVSVNSQPGIGLGSTTSIYLFKIELTLNRILMNLTDCLKYGRVYDYYNNNIFYLNNMKEIYKPKPENLVQHCYNLLEALNFATNSLDNLVKNNNLKALYDKSMIFYHNIISSQNFGYLNLIYLGIIIHK